VTRQNQYAAVGVEPAAGNFTDFMKAESIKFRKHHRSYR
jgi:hypothetical protein